MKLKDCCRCGFTFPRHEFPITNERVRSPFCADCQHVQYLAVHLLGRLAQLRLMTIAAGALLRLGLPSAAADVLNEYRAWPDLPRARQMRRAA